MRVAGFLSAGNEKPEMNSGFKGGASGETRTLTPKAPEPKSGVSTNSTTLAKMWWPHLESNQGHKDFQSFALPTELCGRILIWRIIERGFQAVKSYFKILQNILL